MGLRIFFVHLLKLSSFLIISGAVGLVWSICWFLFVFDTPATHPRISPEERREIEEAIGSSTSKKRPSYVPWGQLLTSSAVWAIIITHGLSVFGFFTVINQLPTYMHDILLFDIKKVREYCSSWFRLKQINLTLEFHKEGDRLII